MIRKRVETYIRAALLLLLCALFSGLPPARAEEQEKPTEDRFAFPPEVVAEEESEAQAEAAAPSKPSAPTPVPGPTPEREGPLRQPSAADAAVAPDVVDPPLPRVAAPRRLKDYTLSPEVLASASLYETPAQRMIASLLEAGDSSVEDLVKLISAESGSTLDHIVINLATQRLYECNVNGDVIREEKISSGARGYDTPPGRYSVVNKAPKAYSKKYTAWMLQWMGLTSDGAYGMHGLEGSSYERHLGKVASHGCIRLSRKYAKELYPRVKVGMPVTIVNDKELKLRTFEPLPPQEARALILEALGPTDPSRLFY